ncbi:DUF2871 domain-containing protein [Helcobacillus massiliensis]|uniref:Glucan phosphoethanolaminetransferase (Alkaline phosphatase superfamily) n=1 Tax=Helcobacillus massiliensis TaxID=521392 RepID=A0A839QXY1_9MICO|nr:DUF2871 domain-containing protein [Helcobacillus massiliensis]MBB3023700.1 glucan phosphoethanolaminetransferase (alkaline phosphatase superfamily) [Helcobacillus massiliensis]MDK7741283.1 DUF2871 domain-containing protein [Helcobacillus massiliensis]WOO92865.1 DUF2871 domain-containing protein [Helcobacillus massiliensis]
MMKNYAAAVMYTILGLVSGLFYREYTKSIDAVGVKSQLSTVHTHLLALGLLMALIMIALDASLRLSGRRSFTVFFWVYNAGVLLTSVMMVIRGILTLQGKTEEMTTAAIPGIAGLGHMLITGGLIALLVALYGAIKDREVTTAEPAAR